MGRKDPLVSLETTITVSKNNLRTKKTGTPEMVLLLGIGGTHAPPELSDPAITRTRLTDILTVKYIGYPGKRN